MAISDVSTGRGVSEYVANTDMNNFHCSKSISLASRHIAVHRVTL